MLILGDSLIPFEKIFKIENINQIEKTASNSTLMFEFDEVLLTYCYENSLSFAVIIKSLKDAIYANNLNAKYIICKDELVQKVQKVADNYMFDSKILSIINSSNQIEDVALKEIDGAIYRSLL